MSIWEIVKKLNLKVIAGENQLEKEAYGVYVCDLLSWVMSHAEKNNIWITVQSNINIVAIASLLDLSCVIIPENIIVDDATIKKANEKEVIILSSESSAYEISMKLYELFKR